MSSIEQCAEADCESVDQTLCERRCGCICVCMCGVPASGKTSLSKAICEIAKESEHIKVSHLEFDCVLHAKSEAAGGSFDSELWHTSRSQYLNDVEQALIRMNSNKNERNIVLVDDNFTLPSMRLAVARIAERHGCAFAVIAITQSVEIALERNRMRAGVERVDETVMKRMFESIEFPWEHNHFWERLHLHIDGTIISSVKERTQIALQWLNSIPIKPVVLVDPSKAKVAKDDKKEEQSIKNQFDLWMRKVVNHILISIESSKRSQVSKAIASAKKSALKPTTQSHFEVAKRDFLSNLQQIGLVVDDSLLNIV